jgi:hypothetical protein
VTSIMESRLEDQTFKNREQVKVARAIWKRLDRYTT